MSDTKTVDAPLDKPSSAEALRTLHLGLLRQWGDLSDDKKRKRAEEFRQEAARAGAYIKSPEDRDAVQGLIDYWSATIASLPTVEAYPDAVPLADFNAATVQKEHGRCPFVQLNPFGIGDAPYYFGRAADVEALLEILKDNLMAVVAGPSGTGKTSLAQAGIAARLVAEPGKWALIGTVRPGRDPVGALLGAVRPANSAADWIDGERVALAKTPDRFRELAEARIGAEQGGLLIVDRAEELFASDVVSSDILLAANAIAAFSAGSADKRHRVLLTIREDFFDQLSALAKPTGNDLPEGAVRRLGSLTSDNLRDVIVKPGEKEGFGFDDAVVTDLIQDTLGQPDALPLLEFALTYMWNRAEVDRVSLADYQRLPKPSQLLTDVAERAYASLPLNNGQEIARIALLEMIRVGQDITGRRVRREDLQKIVKDQLGSDADLDSVLNSFRVAGLVRRIPAESVGDDRFELSHSVVIRHWPRLIVWLQEKRRAEAGLERYTSGLERWRANHRRSRYLLSLGALLDSSSYRGASSAVDEYIAASRRWWIRIGVATLLSVVLIVGLFTCQDVQFTRAFDQLTQKHIEAESAAREASAAGADFNRQAMIADQTLLRAIESGMLARDAVPQDFLTRLDLIPSPPPRSAGYDPQFLDPDSAAQVPLPRFRADQGRLIEIKYPHTTVIYDPVRKIPLIVASNRAADGTLLTPFNGIGFFPDPRIKREWQSADRVSPDPNLGRVPLVEWQQAAWVSGGAKAGDASFLNYMPLSVLQRWPFYNGLWATIDRRLLAIDANRLTVLTGPILTDSDPVVDGSVVPQAYWKVAVRWDAAAGALVSEVYIAKLDASPDTPAAQAASTLDAVAGSTGLDFGRQSAQVAQAAAPKAQTPTVYLQFAAMSRRDAFEISRKLSDLGYKVPPEERLDSAAGLAEVRYVNPQDRDQAVLLAQRTTDILSSLGYGPATVKVQRPLTWVKNKPPRGVLELWLGLPPPNRATAS